MDKSIIGSMLIAGILSYACGPPQAAVGIKGQVQADGGPLATFAVALWAASSGQPRQLAQVRTSSEGRFDLGSDETPEPDVMSRIMDV